MLLCALFLVWSSSSNVYADNSTYKIQSTQDPGVSVSIPRYHFPYLAKQIILRLQNYQKLSPDSLSEKINYKTRLFIFALFEQLITIEQEHLFPVMSDQLIKHSLDALKNIESAQNFFGVLTEHEVDDLPLSIVTGNYLNSILSVLLANEGQSVSELTKRVIDDVLDTIKSPSYFIDDKTMEFIQKQGGDNGHPGLIVFVRNQKLVVAQVVEGSPASKVNIRPGDVIEKIDHEPVTADRVRLKTQLLAGKVGTSVQITRRRNNKVVSLSLLRENYPTDILAIKILPKDILYIRIDEFTNQSVSRLTKEIGDIKKANTFVKTVLIDLRFNVGGVLNSAIDFAELFLKKQGKIVQIQQRRTEDSFNFNSVKVPVFSDASLVVLVSSMTASGAEFVAGAIQLQDRSVIVGNKTIGSGDIHSILPSNILKGSALKLLTGQMVLNNNQPISEKGVIPDFCITQNNTMESLSLKRKSMQGDQLAYRCEYTGNFDPSWSKNALELVQKAINNDFNI